MEKELVRCELDDTITYVPREVFMRVVFDAKKPERKFISYKEGAERYSLGLTKFKELVKRAHASRQVDGRVLVNMDILDQYIEDIQ